MRRLGLYIAGAIVVLVLSAGSAYADTITLSDSHLQDIAPGALGANVTSADCAFDSGQVNCFARFTGTIAWGTQSFGADHLSGLNYTAGQDNFALTIINSNGSIWTWTVKVIANDGSSYEQTASFGPAQSFTFVLALASGSSLNAIEIIAAGPIPNTSTGSNDRLINFDVLASTGQSVSVSEPGALSLLTVGLVAASLSRRRKL